MNSPATAASPRTDSLELAAWSMVPVGTVIAYAGRLAPPGASALADVLADAARTSKIEASGWMLCDGRALRSDQYPELFAALGYEYGGENGSFQIPDLRNYRPQLAEAAPTPSSSLHYLIRYSNGLAGTPSFS